MDIEHSRAQIIATVGPASGNIDTLKKMIEHQADLFRINFSHGDYDTLAEYISLIKKAAADSEKRIPIIQDLSGPREKTETGHKLDEEAVSIITEKDKRDLYFGLDHDVDYIALSFVEKYQDIIELRGLMEQFGKSKPIIAKIERKEALEKLDGIIEAADAIMVARGDLGENMPMEQLPFIQAMIIKRCKEAKKPVIVATQMMLSMTNSPTPTRAEVTDVANAIIQGADAVMLSEESAIGKYPIETVEMMEKIVLEAERNMAPHLPNTLK
ncbi:MAG TPA: pyruvate kinase [Candidatus Paceibacterota bacterium]|nr:pyruvate kinase [Candidatus Paceibacterota bacterium]